MSFLSQPWYTYLIVYPFESHVRIYLFLSLLICSQAKINSNFHLYPWAYEINLQASQQIGRSLKELFRAFGWERKRRKIWKHVTLSCYENNDNIKFEVVIIQNKKCKNKSDKKCHRDKNGKTTKKSFEVTKWLKCLG